MKRLICSNCNTPAVELFSGFDKGIAYTDICSTCVSVKGSSEFYRRFERQNQRKTFARDIIQPSEPEYIKAYGAQQARERGWSEDEIRKNL